MHGIDPGTVFRQGWPVLSVLMLMSVASLAVALERFFVFRKARLDTGRFVEKLCAILQSRTPADAAVYCAAFSQPLATACAAVVSQPGDSASRERALRHALQTEIHGLEAYIPILGTVASTAPFVGLFGTVVGIIRAFNNIGAHLGGGPEVVAPGIAEALVSTAAGLIVAVPALIAYNYYARQLQRLVAEIELASYDVIECLSAQSGFRA